MIVAIVSGGAPRKDDPDPRSWLDVLEPLAVAWLDEFRPDFVFVGDAAGVDAVVCEWCIRERDADPTFDAEFHKARWRQLGRKAGPVRNRKMAERGAAFAAEGHQVVLGAFPGPKSTGTWDMVSTCEELGIPVKVFGPWGNRHMIRRLRKRGSPAGT